MRIRTVHELQDAIDSETGWRKRELIAIKANIQTSRKFAKSTALRSGITLLYAHWEGAIKNIAYYYLCYVSSLKLPYIKLKDNFLAISIKSDLLAFSSTSKASIQTQIVSSIFNKQNTTSQIPQEGIIKTDSNLNSAVFIEIAETIGVDISEYEMNFTLLDEVLLNMRNKIAHGERLESISLDEERYNEIHSKILNMIEQFAIQISNSASLENYLKQ